MARAMKDSGIPWVGEIPEEWETNKLKYLATYNDDVLGEDIDPLFEFDYIDIGSVEYGKGITQLQRMTFSNAPSRARRMVKENDVILSTVRTYLKAVAMIRSFEIPQVASTGFIVLRAIERKIIPSFLHYAVLSNAFISLVEASSTGISYPAINATEVAEMSIPVPPIEIQRSIAQFLDNECARIDAVIEQTRASIEEYKKLKQAVITQAVTKGIRPNRPMKNSGIDWIGEIPNDYIVERIKHLGNYRNGLTYSPENILDQEQGVLVLRSSNIQQGKLCFNDNVYVKAEIPASLFVQKGDIIICSRNGSKELIGKCAIIEEDMIASFGAFMMIYRCVAPKYMYYILNSNVFKYYLSSFLTSTINQLTSSVFGNMRIVYCPDKEEQDEIIEYLEQKTCEFDTIIGKKQDMLTELETYKKSMIFEYVTGKKSIQEVF